MSGRAGKAGGTRPDAWPRASLRRVLTVRPGERREEGGPGSQKQSITWPRLRAASLNGFIGNGSGSQVGTRYPESGVDILRLYPRVPVPGLIGQLAQLVLGEKRGENGASLELFFRMQPRPAEKLARIDGKALAGRVHFRQLPGGHAVLEEGDRFVQIFK